MKILFLNWKDIYHPHAGGAEIVHQELMKRLVRDGHEVSLLTSRYANSTEKDFRDGIHIYRVGTNRYLHTFLATFCFWKNFRNKFDVVISCNNTAPYFASVWKGKEKHFAFYHQLAREVWFFETGFPLNWFGYLILEPVSLFIQAIFNPKVITISESTKKDLLKYCFKEKNIFIISEGIELEPVESLESINKFSDPTILSLGALRPMKRTLDIVKAFEFTKFKVPQATLVLAGDTSGKYGQEVLDYISKSQFKDSIVVKGRVSKEEKLDLMRKSHVLAVTSIKEGWGLVVTEANSQGTPAVVYDVDGLRDSVKNGETGIVAAQNIPQSLSLAIFKMLGDVINYNSLRVKAWESSKQINFDQAYKDFYSKIS